MFKRYQVDQKQVSTVNAVGQFLLNNERQRFELWGRAYNFRARAPTERRIIPRESSGNALEPHAWLDLASSWLLSFFLLFLKYFRHRINLLSRLYPSRRDREDRGRETVETFGGRKPAGESARLSDRVAHAFCGKWCACSRNKRRQRRG